MDGGEEVASGLVVARGDSTKLLELGEEVFDEVPGLIEIAVIVTGHFAVSFGRNDRRLTGGCEGFEHPVIGIKGLVGDECVGFHAREQPLGADQIMRLAAGQRKANRVAQRIDQRMDLARQPTFTAPDGLVFTPLLRAPALC